MSIGVPVYTIQCDEPGCRNVDTFPLAQPHPGLYQLPNVDAVYAHFGGEALPDGGHRCAKCRAKDKPEPLTPEQIGRNLDQIRNTPGAFATAQQAEWDAFRDSFKKFICDTKRNPLDLKDVIELLNTHRRGQSD